MKLLTSTLSLLSLLFMLLLGSSMLRAADDIPSPVPGPESLDRSVAVGTTKVPHPVAKTPISPTAAQYEDLLRLWLAREQQNHLILNAIEAQKKAVKDIEAAYQTTVEAAQREYNRLSLDFYRKVVEYGNANGCMNCDINSLGQWVPPPPSPPTANAAPPPTATPAPVPAR